MKESKLLQTLAWILIIGAFLAWVSAFLLGLLSNPLLGFIGIVVLVVVGFIAIRVFHEQTNDVENNYYSKHIDK